MTLNSATWLSAEPLTEVDEEGAWGSGDPLMPAARRSLAVVESVWDKLAELETAGHSPRLLAAVRFVLIHHEPTRAGRCRACRRGELAQAVAAEVSLMRGVAPDPG